MVNEYEYLIQPPEQFRDAYEPIPPPRLGKRKNVKPKPVPRKGVKQMVKEYEDITQPPEQFRDAYKPIPNQGLKAHFKCWVTKMHEDCQRSPPPPPKREHEEPDSITDKPSSKIKELRGALKGHAKSYEVEIQDNLNPLNHFTETKALVELNLDLLKTMNGFKFIETLQVTFKKIQRLENLNIFIQNSIFQQQSQDHY